jgi:hypothetical protein
MRLTRYLTRSSIAFMAASRLGTRNGIFDIVLTFQVWKEGASHVAYSPELDISTCADSASRARTRLREAVSLFVEEAARVGTLQAILAEAGFEKHRKTHRPRPFLARKKST